MERLNGGAQTPQARQLGMGPRLRGDDVVFLR